MKTPELKKIAWIDCIFLPLEETYSLTSSIRINAGSDYETDEEAGISHFLEHLSFKGWKKWNTPTKLRDAVMDMGWVFNAGTGDRRTNFFIKAPYKTSKLQLDILSDMIVNTLYNEKEIEKEKWVIIQELKKSKDNNIKEAYFQGREFFLWKNNFSRPTLWNEENIKKFTQEDFLNYKKQLYTKDNSVIAIAWKIEDQKFIEEKIKENFSTLPDKKTRDYPKFKRDLPEHHTTYIEKWLNQARIAIFIPSVSLTSKEYFPCTLLAMLLKKNLFKTIREELWLCYDISVNCIAPKEYGFFLIETGVHPDKIEITLEKINEIIDKIIINWIDDNETTRIKNGQIWNTILAYETAQNLSNFYCLRYLQFKKIITLDEWINSYEQVKKEDIENMLPLLKKDKRYTFYIK